jgi:hypothetical protein
MKENTLIIPDEVVLNKIYIIRGQKVMLDRDLAELYGVETKQLKRQVKRNFKRFPPDFMFELSKKEFENWRSQFVTSNPSERMGLRYAPYVFTEQGVAMLSSILTSDRAIEVNIRIVRIFTQVWQMILTNKDILLKLERLEKQSLKNTDDIQLIFRYLKKLLTPDPQVSRKRIGY